LKLFENWKWERESWFFMALLWESKNRKPAFKNKNKFNKIK